MIIFWSCVILVSTDCVKLVCKDSDSTVDIDIHINTDTFVQIFLEKTFIENENWWKRFCSIAGIGGCIRENIVMHRFAV